MSRTSLVVLLAAIGLGSTLGGCRAVSWTFEADPERTNVLAADYPDEDAVILHRTHTLHVGTRETLWHTHTLAKVLTEKGRNDFSRVSFVLDDSRDLVDFAARVIRPNGDIQDIDLASALEETTTDATSKKSTRTVKLRLPGVEAGSLVEVIWTVAYAFQIASISVDIADEIGPVQKYDLRVRVHKRVPFQLRTYHSSKKLRVTRQTQHTLITLHDENIAKMKREDYSPNASMRNPFWKYAAAPTGGVPKWEQSVKFVADILYDDATDLVDGFRTSFATTPSKCETRNCQIDAAIEYVRYKTDLDSGGTVRSMSPLARVLANGKANRFEKAMLLRRALNDLNLKAEFALATKLFTQPTDEGFPSPDWFNHLLVVVTDGAGERLVIDPSCEHCSRGELPDRSRGGRALLLDYNKRRSPELSTSFIVAKGKAVPGDVVAEKLKVKLRANGDAAYVLRREWKGDAASRENQRTRSKSRSELYNRGLNLAHAHVDNSSVQSVKYASFDKRRGELRTKVKFRSQGYGVVDGDRLVVPLSLLLPAYGKGIRESAKEARVGDFFFANHVVRSEVVELVLPPGFVVASLPASFSEKGPAFTAQTTWKNFGDRIVLERTLDVQRGRVSRSKYNAVMRPLLAYVGTEKDVVIFQRIPVAPKRTAPPTPPVDVERNEPALFQPTPATR